MPTTTLLVIDDDDVDRKAVRRALRDTGAWDIHEASSGEQGLGMARVRDFDCILVDYRLPDLDGLDLLTRLRDHPEVTAPVVMLTGEGNELVAVDAMKRGASDYLPKAQLAPGSLFRVIVNAIEKHNLQTRLDEAQRKLEHLALYDTLTELGNRNLFNRELARAIAVAARQGASFRLMVMDLDRFKAVNDTFGHEAGDAVLAEVGRRFLTVARASDRYFRLGGDEFAAILNGGADLGGANAVIRRLKAMIPEPVTFGAHQLHIGISIGVASYSADGVAAEELIRAADAAMYAAKNSTPGRTAVSDDDA